MENIDHPAAPWLASLRDNGVPVRLNSPPWTPQRKQKALERGPHKSSYEYGNFILEEFLEFVRKGFWFLLPARLILHLLELRLSPLGCVPQHERRPRIIVDYTYSGVNQETEDDKPDEAMKFGHALPRVLACIANANPNLGPVKAAKYDLSDAFYRIQLAPNDVPKLGVLLPPDMWEEPLVAFPMTLPMGWTKSPPYLCVGTETVADKANSLLEEPGKLTHHRLEKLAHNHGEESTSTWQPPLRPRHYSNDPLRYSDVYMDDLIGLSQGESMPVTRAILHSIDMVFRPLDSDDSPFRQEPVSVKKLNKGDGHPTTVKTILGWRLDLLANTLELTPRRRARLDDILSNYPRTRQRTSVTEWQKVLGELRSMAVALPGSRGLFSSLQFAFKPSVQRIRLTKPVHDTLDDFRWIASQLDKRPTRIFELVPGDTYIIGSTDASGHGMGGSSSFLRPKPQPPLPLTSPICGGLSFRTTLLPSLSRTTTRKGASLTVIWSWRRLSSITM